MKKIVSTFAFALLLGGLTFAEDMKPAVTVGAWGRGIFIPVATGGQVGGSDVTQSILGVSWGGAPRVGITVAGNSENVGFQMDVNADNSSISVGDQQKIWVKPFEGVTIQVGEAYDDTLRGNGTFGSFDWVRNGAGTVGEDFTFSRLDTGKGFEVSYAAGDLYVFGAFRNLAGNTGYDLNKVVLKNTQEGIGYTIKDVGQIRVQAIGHAGADAVTAVADTTFSDANGDGKDDTYTGTTGVSAADAYQQVQVAFKLTAVQNVYADIGIDYPSDKTAAGHGLGVNAYANYTMDKAKIHLLVGYQLPATGSDANIQGGLGFDYGLDGGLALSSDLRYQNKFAAGNDNGNTGVFVGITKGFSNGLIGVGVQYATALISKAGANGPFSLSNTDTKAGLLIPVRVEYWF